MKNKLTILFLLIYSLCLSQNDIDFSKLRVTEARVDSINLYFNKVLKSSREQKNKFEKLFFKLLPNCHSEMRDAMYINAVKQDIERKKGKDNISFVPNPWVEYLSKMDYNDKDAYYEKYFNICIGGEYKADYLMAGFEIYKRFLTDTKTACEKLGKLNNKKIESIFFFMLDEPHPKNKESIILYNEMLLKIKKENLRLSDLLKKSYMKIVKKRSNH